MTTHDRYNLMISLLLDDMLILEEQEELYQHMADCPQCSETYDNMLSLDMMFRAPIEAAPAPDFSARVMARLEEHELQRRRLPWLIGLMVFASLMVGASFAAPVMFFTFGLHAWLPDVTTLVEISHQAAFVLNVVVGSVAGAWEAVGAWCTSLAEQPSSLVVGLMALVLVSTWIGLLEVFKPRAAMVVR